MRAFGLLIGLGGAVLVFLYLNGSLPGFGAGTRLPAGTAPDLSGPEGTIRAWTGTPSFYTFCVAAVLATVGVVTWAKIGGWGRAVVLVCAAIAVTVLVTR